jgi:ketol-acid reductoisomerase
MKVLYDADANLDLLRGRRIAIVGYGAQGHAHALNLTESGMDVTIGIRPGSAGWARAEADGFTPQAPVDAVDGADVIGVFVPDHVQPEVWSKVVAPALRPGATVLFAHGFNIHFGYITPPAGHDVIMVAPKSPGHRVRELYEAGAGTPGLVAVAQDASGNALQKALAYGTAIGCGRMGMLETTFGEETESDLFGEQAVLCGGATALMIAGFETLVEAGYQPEIAYYEVLHELKLIVDLIYEGGLERMHYSISDTAEYGSHAVGPRVVDERVKENMKQVLTAIQDGSFAREWIEEMDRGRPSLAEYRSKLAETEIEQVGARLRALGEREVTGAHGVG